MNLLDLAQDNLLDIICLIAADPSPRNVLYIGKIAQTCKLLYNLTKHPKIWLELSKTWFLAEHAKTSRIEFIKEIFNYNFPDESSEYNLNRIHCKDYLVGDPDIKKMIYGGFDKFPPIGQTTTIGSGTIVTIPVPENDKEFRFNYCKKMNGCDDAVNSNTTSIIDVEIIEKPTHAMLICMCRFGKGKKGITHDENNQWIHDNYYVHLAKKVSFLSEYMNQELGPDSFIVKKVKDVEITASNLTKLIDSYSLIDVYADLLEGMSKIIPDGHFTKNMYDGYKAHNISFPQLYINNFYSTDIKFNLLGERMDQAANLGRINMLTYLKYKTMFIGARMLIYGIRGLNYVIDSFKYIGRGLRRLTSFIY